MPLIRTLLLLLVCCFMGQSLFAQSSLKKAETYYQLNAHFLSIKYFQKHLKEATTDRDAMLKLAECYQKAEMPKQSRKWLLKAHNCKDLSSYFRKLANSTSTGKALQQIGANLLKTQIRHLYLKENIVNLTYKTPENKSLFAMTIAGTVSNIF